MIKNYIILKKAPKAMVSSDMGCTILPMAVAADEIERGELTYAEIIDPSAELCRLK